MGARLGTVLGQEGKFAVLQPARSQSYANSCLLVCLHRNCQPLHSGATVNVYTHIYASQSQIFQKNKRFESGPFAGSVPTEIIHTFYNRHILPEHRLQKSAARGLLNKTCERANAASISAQTFSRPSRSKKPAFAIMNSG